MASVGIGVTIGSHSLRAVKVRRKGAQFVVMRAFADRLEESVRPVAGRALGQKGITGAPATVGLTGRDVIIRYSQVPPVPEWRLKNLMKFEVEEVGSQSGGDVSADYRKLELPDPEGTRSEETVLVALARNRHLDSLIKALAEGGIKPEGGCPNGVALFNAFAINATYTEDETCLLANIGAQNVDVAIQRGGELLFARNATPGAQAFTEAIARAFATTEGKAEQMKLAKADVTPKGQARYPDSTAEKVANALMGAAGQLASLIQSTLMIARAQTKVTDLKVDRVVLAGGGASLKGLDLYLKQAMGVPVERLDPFALSDLSELPAAEREAIEKAPHEFAVVMGLAQARLSPAAFRLSVLPATLKARRDFATKGVFAVLAGVVSLGTLALLHAKMSAANAEGRRQVAALKREGTEAKKQDTSLREVVASAQEEDVKAKVLADVAAPGDLLARVMAVVEKNLTKDLYVQSVQLKLQERSNEFPYLRPRSAKEAATGYEEVTRTRYFRRDAMVQVRAKIGGGQRGTAVYQTFVQSVKANGEGLVAVPNGVLKQAAGGQDAEFAVDFFPGLPIPLETEPGAPTREVIVRSARLDDDANPTAVVGHQADGSPVEIKVEQVSASKRKDLIESLKGQAAPAPDQPDGPK